MKEESYREGFKKNVSNYEKITQTKHIKLIYNLEKDVLDEIFSKIDSKSKSVMDFACGSGRWTQYLETKFKSTVGVDISEEMVKYAKEKCKKTEFFVTDITRDKDRIKREFDVLTAFRFYKNAEETLREEATKELVKYVKSDGYFIFDLHLNKYSFMGMWARVLKFLRFDSLLKINPLTVRTISLKDVKGILEENGFEIVDYYGTGFLPGRSNYIILPYNWLYKLESFFTRKKIFRNFSYNLLVVCKKV